MTHLKSCYWAVSVWFLAGAVTAPVRSEVVYTRDFGGKWVEVTVEEWHKGKNPVTLRTKGTALQYTVTHNDAGTGQGFDDPVYGAARLATVNAVLAYLDSVLLNDGRVDVEFNPSLNDGSGSTLASAGSFYPASPPGYEAGYAFEHIVTGTDPSPSLPDIQVTVDFGHPWNSELDDPAVGEFDLFSVILHELTHGLGILSLVDSDGTSEVSGTNPGVFATFDPFLETGNGKQLFGAGGVFLGTASDLVGSDNGVFFRGIWAIDQLGVPPRIFTPNPWQPGSSMGHWSSVNSNQSVMLPGISPGTKRREYRTFELGALRDLGYNVALPQPGTSQVDRWQVYK